MSTRMTMLRPMLAVTELKRTIQFYCDKLGFKLIETFGDPPVWCELERDEVQMMFNAPPSADVQRDVSARSRDYQIFYVNVNDVAAMREDLIARGAPVSELRVTIYGMKEFEVRDPDNIWLWFGEPTDDEPTVRE